MDFSQSAILLLLIGMLVVFALDRIRMELVAVGGLGLGVVLGLVAPAEAFSGFSNPAFVTVVEILLIVQVLARSGILDPMARRVSAIASTETGVLLVLCLATACLSVFMNNIGALALMIPVVISVCRVNGLDSRRLLMPVSFASLLGGLCSLIGTPANLIVSNQLEQATGRGFDFFDFALVGVPAALAGLLVLLVWPRRVLGCDTVSPARLPPQAFRTVVSEIRVAEGSALVGLASRQADVTIHAVRRGGTNIFHQRHGTVIEPGDILLVETSLPQLETLLSEGSAELAETASSSPARQRVEAVIMPESTLVGSRIGTLDLLYSRGIDVVAVAVQLPRIERSLADLQLSIGDVIYLAGDQAAIDDVIDEADILLLWPRPGGEAKEVSWRPVIAFAGGIGLAACGLAPPELAFGFVVLVLAALGSLDLRKGLGELDWPTLLLLAAMIPLGQAIHSTGTAAILADRLISVLPSHNPPVVAATMMGLAIVITPFVNNASTAVVLGPVALGLATASGISPELLLIAVALGASVDFLTPIGHHNNTIVMGVAGYRFADFLKAGWPVTLAAAAAASGALWVWWT